VDVSTVLDVGDLGHALESAAHLVVECLCRHCAWTLVFRLLLRD
jgi:hypothetical protein